MKTSIQDLDPAPSPTIAREPLFPTIDREASRVRDDSIVSDRRRRLAVCSAGCIGEIRGIHQDYYVGINLFTGNRWTSSDPTFLSVRTEQSIRDLIARTEGTGI